MQTREGFLTIGQPLARTIAIRSRTRARTGRPLLVHGPPGAGKGAFVADLLALLVCDEPDSVTGPCNRCRSCLRARAGTHSDIVVASPDTWRAARQGDESIVAVTRRWLLDVASAPVEGEVRIAVIEQADRCTEHSQNALLKALEEPSPRHQFVLVAERLDRLLPTIRSRCQPLRIGPVPRRELATWLAESRLLPDDQADALARLAGGHIGLADSFVRRADLVDWRRRLQTQLLVLLERGRADRFRSGRDAIDEAAQLLGAVADGAPLDDAAVQEVAAAGRVPAARQRAAALAVTDVWMRLARDLLVHAAGRPSAAVTADLAPDFAAFAARLDPKRILRFVDRLEEIREGLVENASARLALEVAMLEWPTLEPAPAAGRA